MDTNIKQKNHEPIRLANKRGMARLASVQALYQMEIAGTSITKIIDEYKVLCLGWKLDNERYLAADTAWFCSLVNGVIDKQKMIDPLIGNVLPCDWPFSRVNVILRAILRTSVFELTNKLHVPPAVVISEYVDITKAFLDDGAPGMVNAVLNKILHNEVYLSGTRLKHKA